MWALHLHCTVKPAVKPPAHQAAGDDVTRRVLNDTAANAQGVWEKDAERKDDSFNSFEEVVQMAVEKDVDLLLLGGDLFHDNKPSRSTVSAVTSSSLTLSLSLNPSPSSSSRLSLKAATLSVVLRSCVHARVPRPTDCPARCLGVHAPPSSDWFVHQPLANRASQTRCDYACLRR